MALAWLKKKLSNTPAADAAIGLVDEVTLQAKSLREQLEPFRLEADPFAAIVIKQIMTQAYEAEVEFMRTPRATT